MSGEWDRREFMKSLILPAGMLSVSLRGQAQAGQMHGGVPLVAFRIAPRHWLTDDCFDALLDFFARQPGAVDELAFFTSETHPPLPMEVIRPRAERLRKILPRVRQHGMKAGVNVLATMGHHEENLANSLNKPWQHVMDPSGNISRGSYCPAHPELINYARELHSTIAEAGPDFIWIDDDVRLEGHGPVRFTCFCDLCVQQFSRQVGTQFTRETLVAAFASGTLEERLHLRREWLERNRRVIDNLLRNIEEAVHLVKPGLPLGYMTGDRFYEGYDFERWAKTLAGPGQSPVRWRPGGGFYSDEDLLGLVDKANALGRQVSALPPQVETIESEVESFPYQRLRKSRQATVVEAAAYMGAGTTGSAFNVLSMYKDPLGEYVPLFDRISQDRSFYQKLQSALGRDRATGIWPAWNRDLFSAVNPDGNWLSDYKLTFNETYVLGQIGIPLCYHPDGGTATALAGSTVFAFSQQELRHIFSGGVLMDGKAWLAMKRLGMERWTGVRAMENVDHDATEVLSKHPINGRFAGWSRDCRQSFWRERAYRLQAQDDGVGILAGMVDYGGRNLGPCMTAYRNELGGRVVIMGYFPWSQIHSLEKSSQMKAVCAWTSQGRLPVVAESFKKVVLWCREGAGGKKAIVVLNASLDPVERLSLRVLTRETAFTQIGPTQKPKEISAERLPSSHGYVRVILSDLAPWSAHLLVMGRT
ncbi:MAG TPA: hypothetical protein VMW54_07705 [Terriglobia bacterium]|nr:hypothetical protein [Terriglobia bacterium]